MYVQLIVYFLLQVLPIYMHVRVLVSSYLFLSAFGHFYYFYAKADYSFRRVGMVRLCFMATVSVKIYLVWKGSKMLHLSISFLYLKLLRCMLCSA